MECEACGIAPCDLPDEVDVEFMFDTDDEGIMYCMGCLYG